ncbi:hypothetical protein J1N35_007437 [Gossypium stocksii]|uniref:Rab GDP dissociation inhibitor n=1 Tax=Gossypium stocksii TaxID=47602 RepID=A0A9D4AF93_9ROSI|nr:hypothetical protein J1N35_007437 [Gossypium stocksii]
MDGARSPSLGFASAIVVMLDVMSRWLGGVGRILEDVVSKQHYRQLTVSHDAVVLGTALNERILSSLLSVHRLKVLHMDRNEYYGGEPASLNPIQVPFSA